MSKQEPAVSDQANSFLETARKLGRDEDEKMFDEKLRKIANANPPSSTMRPVKRGAKKP